MSRFFLSRPMVAFVLAVERWVLSALFLFLAYEYLSTLRLLELVSRSRDLLPNDLIARDAGLSDGVNFSDYARYSLLVISNFACGILLLVSRQPRRRPTRSREVLIPLAATFSYMIFNHRMPYPAWMTIPLTPPAWEQPLAALGVGWCFVGVMLSLGAMLWLGRSLGIVISVREIVLGGPYRYVRHPIYLGYLFILGGLLLTACTYRRKPIQLTRPMKAPESRQPRTGDIACDEALFERLRIVRKRLADERAVPSYIIFSDVALRWMARLYPSNPREFRDISGVGDRKLADFGDDFLAEIKDYLGQHPKQIFADDSFESPTLARRSNLTATVLASLQAFRQGKTVAAIAAQRALTTGTIFGHLAIAMETGEAVDLREFLTETEQAEIEAALAQHPGVAMTPVHQALGGRYDFGLIRLVRAATVAKLAGTTTNQ